MRKVSLVETHPELATQWHPDKNGSVKAADVSKGMVAKYWWLCDNGHEWKASCNRRTSQFSGCPFCSGRMLTDKNRLSICKPELSKEWHPDNPKLSSEFHVTSNKRAKWICRNGHSWYATISDRANGNGCPYCSGKKTCKDNCLATMRPDIAKEWHPANNKLSSFDVVSSSNKRVWWLCKHGHEWQAMICNRTRLGRGCPYCSGRSPSPTNCFAHKYPELITFWDYDVNQISPHEITPRSKKRIAWKCPSGHKWETSAHIFSISRRCHICDKWSRQRLLFNVVCEIFAGSEVAYNFKHQEMRFYKSNRPMELDIFVPSKNIAFEYQGRQHYHPVPEWGGEATLSSIRKRDAEKRAACADKGICLIEINYDWDGSSDSIIQELANRRCYK